jgi:hypothetical protein
MEKQIDVEVTRYCGAYFDGVHVGAYDLERTIRDLYLNQGFKFSVRPACCLVTKVQIKRVKDLLGV